MWTALLLSMLLTSAPDKNAEGKNDKVGGKILARGVWPVSEEKPAHRIVRSGEELAVALGVDPQNAKEKRFQTDATADTAKLLKVKDIDWSKQMLIVVAAGAKRTGGHRVEIVSLTLKDETLTVNWKLHSPPPDAIVTQAISYPSQMVLVERFRDTVRFNPPIEKK
jgi:hypothetical protein